MKKQIIRLTESDLHSMIEETVNKILEGRGVLKGKRPNYWARDTKCPKCGSKEGNPFMGGLCPACAKAKNIENGARV